MLIFLSDPLPFQWLARDPALCANTKFVDVDYEPLMQTKCKIVKETSRINSLLNPVAPETAANEKSILFESQEYVQIGCDLRNTRRLERLLRSVVDLDRCLILCVAEVSITYMHTEAADALIAWSSTISPDVTFCLLEQCSPDQADNPFTMTMVKHFAKLGTPIHSVFTYPGLHAQSQRFREAGFTHVDYNNLWELWSDSRFLSPSQRMALDDVEPFDEWEEFALFASHYCLVVAHNRDAPVLTEHRHSRRDSTVSISSDISARTSSPHKPQEEWFAFRYFKEPGDLCQRHHGSAYPVPHQDAIAVHGGVGVRSKLGTTAVARPRHYKDATPVVPPLEIAARSCHTITPLDDGRNLLVGGRASPSQAFKDCWLQTGDKWERVQDLPVPRYRHRVVPVELPDYSSGAICYGGKCDARTVVTDVLLWDASNGWRPLRTGSGDPVPRFGPLFLRLGHNHGLLFGGMRQDGVVCQGLWRWRFVIRDTAIVNITFKSTTVFDVSAGTWPWFARFGASYSMQRDEVLIIGGIAKSGCLPKTYEILSLIGCFSNYKDQETEMPLRIGCVTPTKGPDCPRPFLVGHSTHRTRNGLSITLGGGATCFSFGNYFNTGIWILYDREAGMTTDWVIIPSKPAQTTIEEKKIERIDRRHEQEVHVEQTKPASRQDANAILRRCIPQILGGMDFGQCVHRWTVAYLRELISPTRAVTIHNSGSSRTMNFLRKDFSYQTIPFHNFLAKIADRTTHLYLRSLAANNPSTTPANLAIDWPEIADDFQIPEQLRDIESHVHSSPLRISNDTNMWLHYDVMANVLFQVKGVKKLAIFPDTDLPKLCFPPGSTTSELDLFERLPGAEYDLTIPEGTTPVIAILKPGDALFIPPLWSHTGVSLPSDLQSPPPRSGETSSHDGPDQNERNQTRSEPNGTCEDNPFLNIAVNLFFRNLPDSTYAAGRDVYGNRNLAAYEEGRRDLDKIVRRFTAKSKENESAILLPGIPRCTTKAYLLRLAKELEEKAESLQPCNNDDSPTKS